MAELKSMKEQRVDEAIFQMLDTVIAVREEQKERADELQRQLDEVQRVAGLLLGSEQQTGTPAEYRRGLEIAGLMIHAALASPARTDPTKVKP